MERVADVRPTSAIQPTTKSTFAELIAPLIEPGFRLAMAMLHDASAAEDAVQEASFTAWRKFGSASDEGKLRSWFLGIVANKCRNARRRKWSADVRLGLSEETTVPSTEDLALRDADLRRAIASLGHDDRLVLVLYFYLDMPLEDIALVARGSVAATRARLYRSIKKLRPNLDLQEALR